MSDYQRIVSYLYEYSHGIKGANVGFAKIEKRQKKLRLYFHVKTNDKSLEYKIYFYHFHHGTMKGTLLDTIKRKDSVIEFKKTYPMIIDLDSADGFLIYYSDDHFFGSQWKDHPITIRNFTASVPQKSTENPRDPVSIPENDEKTSDEKQPINEHLPSENKQSSDQPPALNETEDLNESETLNKPETLNESETLNKPETLDESETSATSKLVKYIEALQLEKEAKEQPPIPCSSDFDWKSYPSLPLPAAYQLSPSVKIQLEDLNKIPNLPANIQTNGFLLLNYGNYGHLCLAWSKKQQCRCLGIPGIFDNEKAFISKLFGFQEFITVPVTPQKTGNFGYFLLPI